MGLNTLWNPNTYNGKSTIQLSLDNKGFPNVGHEENSQNNDCIHPNKWYKKSSCQFLKASIEEIMGE